MKLRQNLGHHLETMLPGLKVLRTAPVAAGADRQSSIEVASVEKPDGQRREMVVRSPQVGALGMDAAEDCARRVMALYRTRDLPFCASIHAVWGVDASGQTLDLRNIQSWHIAEEAVAGVPLSALLSSSDKGRNLVGLFEQLGTKLAQLHTLPERPANLSPSRGVRESLAGPEGAMPIFAGFPAEELRANDTLAADYVTLAARLAWRLESGPPRPTASCHGDLHPGNILVDENSQLMFIDRSRTETCEPASDVASVLVNLIRIRMQPADEHIDTASLAEAFINSYDSRARNLWAEPLGYYLLTRMPAAVSPAFNPTVDAGIRWKTLGWMYDLMTKEPARTAGGWLTTILSINAKGVSVSISEIPKGVASDEL